MISVKIFVDFRLSRKISFWNTGLNLVELSLKKTLMITRSMSIPTTMVYRMKLSQSHIFYQKHAFKIFSHHRSFVQQHLFQ